MRRRLTTAGRAANAGKASPDSQPAAHPQRADRRPVGRNQIVIIASDRLPPSSTRTAFVHAPVARVARLRTIRRSGRPAVQGRATTRGSGWTRTVIRSGTCRTARHRGKSRPRCRPPAGSPRRRRGGGGFQGRCWPAGRRCPRSEPRRHADGRRLPVRSGPRHSPLVTAGRPLPRRPLWRGRGGAPRASCGVVGPLSSGGLGRAGCSPWRAAGRPGGPPREPRAGRRAGVDACWLTGTEGGVEVGGRHRHERGGCSRRRRSRRGMAGTGPPGRGDGGYRSARRGMAGTGPAGLGHGGSRSGPAGAWRVSVRPARGWPVSPGGGAAGAGAGPVATGRGAAGAGLRGPWSGPVGAGETMGRRPGPPSGRECRRRASAGGAGRPPPRGGCRWGR